MHMNWLHRRLQRYGAVPVIRGRTRVCVLMYVRAMHARDHPHAKRVTARVTRGGRGRDKRARAASREDAFAWPEVIRICTSHAYRNAVACEVAVASFSSFFCPPRNNVTTVLLCHGYIVSLTGDHLYARTTLGDAGRGA